MHDNGFQFGARWTRGPAEADDAEAARQQIAQNRRVAVAGRKVGVKARMLPMCYLDL